MALIKSIREGVFFDRKYWARHYKAGDVLKAIYFSSACMGGNVQLLKKCTFDVVGQRAAVLRSPVVKRLKGRNPPVSDLDGDVNVESDCEGDFPGVRSEPVEMKGEGEEPIRAVLTIGSFSAYVHSPITPSSRGMMDSPAGDLSSFIVARAKFHSPPSNRKVLTLA
jgi:hypothetical protein